VETLAAVSSALKTSATVSSTPVRKPSGRPRTSRAAARVTKASEESYSNMPVLNMPTTSKGRMRGVNPAVLDCPEGESRFTRLPMPMPRRLASSSPMMMPCVPSRCRSATEPTCILRSMESTDEAELGSMPRSTTPLTPPRAESITSV